MAGCSTESVSIIVGKGEACEQRINKKCLCKQKTNPIIVSKWSLTGLVYIYFYKL